MIGKYSDQMTFEYILGRMLDRVPDTVDKREGSVIYDALAPAAAELAKTYMELDVVMDETFVDTASLQYLILRCKERGIEAQGETAAIIQGTFTPAELELTAGTRFNCDEVNYAITEKISAGVYRLQAETLGTAGNKYSGTLLPIETVNGLQTAEITGVLIPGEDGDTTDTLREKYYASIDGEAFGGNVADYKEKVNAIPGVGGVKVHPVWNGGGTVKLVIIASDYAFIRDTACPAVICEGVFVDTKADASQADTLTEQQAFGVAYAKGILDTLGIPYDEPEEPEQPVEEPAKEHWAQKHYDSLNAKGVEINETRFDDPITRGDVFALLDRIVR